MTKIISQKDFIPEITLPVTNANTCDSNGEMKCNPNHQTSSSTNGAKVPVHPVQSAVSILPTQIFCPLCLDGQVFLEPNKFAQHLKQKHPIYECESLVNLLKTQLELYNTQNYPFEVNNLATTNSIIKSEMNECSMHVPLVNDVATVTSTVGSTESANSTSCSDITLNQKDVIYDFQLNASPRKSLNSEALSKSIEIIPSVCCYSPSMASQSSLVSSSLSSLPLCSPISSTISNPLISTSRSVGRPLFMPVNSFPKSLSTI
ncbi:unnamed protein product [Heterobilharzia americana]|nr:unnamed protein product [Heterobilharzia americana]